MNTTARLSAADRNRSLARLRSLTVGTTVLSVAAVGGFGALAGFSHPGATAAASTTTTGYAVAADSTTSAVSNAGSDTSSSTSSSTGSTSGLQAVQVPATTSSGTAQVTTGGSGR